MDHAALPGSRPATLSPAEGATNFLINVLRVSDTGSLSVTSAEQDSPEPRSRQNER